MSENTRTIPDWVAALSLPADADLEEETEVPDGGLENIDDILTPVGVGEESASRRPMIRKTMRS